MKEKPILFSGPMVRAILDGRKTQTRRVVKHQPRMADGSKTNWTRFERVGPFFHIMADEPLKAMFTVKCPYGQAGDRLWVKETFCLRLDDGVYQYDAEGNHLCWYRADGQEVVKDDGNGGVEFRKDGSEASPWKPSIFMPRKFSRITLEIVSVRVERLNEISEKDAAAEGVKVGMVAQDFSIPHYKNAYHELWESINGAGSWAKNPWVWVIEFRKV